jgi:DNA-binding CsgD family transcriptional regulator
MGRPSAVVNLDAIERETLQGYTRRFTSAQALAKRARIILLLADGLSGKEVARRIGTSSQTVCV